MLHCVAPPRAAEECTRSAFLLPHPPPPCPIYILSYIKILALSRRLSLARDFEGQKNTMVTEQKPDAMSTLANAASVDVAASGVGAGTKRSGDDLAVAATAKKPKQATTGGLITTQWSNLMTHVRNQLVSMSSDQCFARALELQMLANQILSAQVSGNSFQSHQPIVHTHAPVMAMPSNRQQEGQQPQQQLKQQQQQQSSTRATKAERDVSKQKPIKVTKAVPIPCMKMTTPLPPRCEVDNAPDVEIPTFCELVNFPTARYYQNCVMCDESEYTIPKQNKGVCNNCDVAIWVVNPSGMQIKWCKGCKNFRKWVEFGTKGFSSKCDRCRRQQAVRYSIQKNKGEGGNTMEEESERQAWLNQHAVVGEQQEQRDL